MKLNLVMDTEHLDSEHTRLFLNDNEVPMVGVVLDVRADGKDVNLSVFMATEYVNAHIQELLSSIQELQAAGVRVRFAGEGKSL